MATFELITRLRNINIYQIHLLCICFHSVLHVLKGIPKEIQTFAKKKVTPVLRHRQRDKKYTLSVNSINTAVSGHSDFSNLDSASIENAHKNKRYKGVKCQA